MNAWPSHYETEPIGDGNPYQRCKSCHVSEPEISVRGHRLYCWYRHRPGSLVDAVTLENIGKLHPNALIAWDRDGHQLPEAKPKDRPGVHMWGTEPWNEVAGVPPQRTDGIGCVFYDNYDGRKKFRCVLIRDEADPLGCRWERWDLK